MDASRLLPGGIYALWQRHWTDKSQALMWRFVWTATRFLRESREAGEEAKWFLDSRGMPEVLKQALQDAGHAPGG